MTFELLRPARGRSSSAPAPSGRRRLRGAHAIRLGLLAMSAGSAGEVGASEPPRVAAGPSGGSGAIHARRITPGRGADTLLTRAGLAFLPSVELLPERFVTFTAGYVTPFTGAEGDPPGGGAGNQSYLGEFAWGVSRGFELRVGIELNDDPTWAPIRGARREKSFFAFALAARTVLWSSGERSRPNAADAGPPHRPRWAVGLQASAQIHRQASEPGFFNAGLVEAARVYGAFALELPLTYRPYPRLSLTLVPSVATSPSRLMGASHYGTMARLGAGARFRAGERWMVSGAGELALGPGDNVVDRAGALGRSATWRAGIRWQGTDRVALDGHLTNAAGVTPATRHITLPGDPRILYGVGITYTPSASERASSSPTDAGSAAWTGGITVPAFRTLGPGHGRLETSADTRGAWSAHVHHALGRRFQIELLATRLSGADAPAALDAAVASSWEYRIGGALALADEADGDALSWAHRVSIGRDWDDQQGYLLAEVVASRGLAPGARLVVNPVAIQTDGRSPVSVGVGLRLGSGSVVGLVEGRGAFTGERPVWAVGLATPAGLARLGGLGGQVYATTASGPRELGRVLADRRGWRVGWTLTASW